MTGRDHTPLQRGRDGGEIATSLSYQWDCDGGGVVISLPSRFRDLIFNAALKLTVVGRGTQGQTLEAGKMPTLGNPQTCEGLVVIQMPDMKLRAPRVGTRTQWLRPLGDQRLGSAPQQLDSSTTVSPAP